ncbi:MAG: FAD-dependent oxidoreductase [Desulfobacterales bacterium]|nr:FAD-dependent oxidoreductase [Desulfobacterales bacterium]
MNRGPSIVHRSSPFEGKVLVVGGGIGGIQCAIDLADAGFYVYLADTAYTLGGVMARLDKTFPTNDCSTCMFSPKLVQVAGHRNIEILSNTRLLDLEGDPGRFSARIEKRPRYIDPEKCIACGQCAEKCPKKVPDAFNGELSMRKAAFVTFPQAVPLKYALDPDHCLHLTRGRCGLCKKICPADAVEFDQKPEIVSLSVGAVILAAGFELALTREHGEYGFGRYKNVVSSLQYERMLSATGPTAGHLARPSDGKTPQKVAWIQCVLSRDAARNRPFCSSVCCMHAAKQAVMTRSHLPETEAVIYFMDVRAHGKGFDDYVERARRQHGVQYRRSMISQVYLSPETENLIIETFDHEQHRKKEETFDLLVLSSGFQPPGSWRDLAGRLGLDLNPYGFAQAPFDEPAATNRAGVYVCGGIESPKDIPETVVQAGAAAAEASILLSSARSQPAAESEADEAPTTTGEPRVGVFVCHCGSNISGVVDIPAIIERLRKMPEVAWAEDFVFTCANETQDRLIESIRKHDLNRIVVAACSPKTHEPLFAETLRRAGLNPYLITMANIRNQCSWVHAKEPDKATEKAFSLARGAVRRALYLEPLTEQRYRVTDTALVIGGGISGMTAALTVADQGFAVHLVEKDHRLGGFARNLTETLEGDSPQQLIRRLERRVLSHPMITVYTDSEVTAHDGYVGAFTGTVQGAGGSFDLRYGAVVVATGAQAYVPSEHLHGKDERVLTQVELSRRIRTDPDKIRRLSRVVMIQCIGSRNADFPYCSRVCCSAAVKNSIALKKANPDIQVVVLYRDLRTFGFKELYYLEARRLGALFFRYIPEHPPEVKADGNGKLVVDFTDRSSFEDFRAEADLVVLSAGMRPHEASGSVANLLKLPRTPEGFFMEAHVKLQPMEFSTPGIYLAGLAHSPRFIPESIAMAQGAAQQAAKVLSQKEMRTSATVAEVDPDLCAACLACVRVCPFGAPFINQDGVSEIPPAKCRGCGICPAECPARAIRLKHSTDEQIDAQIDALLEESLG